MASATQSISKKYPPEPSSNYLFGSMRDLQRDQLRFYMDMREQYGDIVRFRVMGPIYAYLVFHPDDIDYVLRRNNQNYHRGIAHQRFKSMLGNGLLTSEGKFWLRQRRLAQPAFHRQRIASFATTMTTATTSMLARWQTYLKSRQPFDVSTEMTRLTLQIVGQTLFSTDISGDDANTVRSALYVALDHINYRTSHLSLPENVPTPRNHRYHKALHTLDTMVYTLIKERRRDVRDPSEYPLGVPLPYDERVAQDSNVYGRGTPGGYPGDGAPGDLLSLLLLARDEETGEGMSDEQVHDEVMTLILAGHETTANALTWTWYLLSQHPAIEDKLHSELQGVLGGRVPTVDDLPHLPYTKMVIDEVLRLYPPAWGLSRHVVADDEIRGHRIPAGSELAVVQYVTHRHPDFWDNPEVFDPERFTPERSAGRPHFAYFPFGGGPRLCIGNTFALMEAHLVLATVAQAYRLRLVAGQRVVPEPIVTLRPRYGVQMTLHTY